MVLIVSTSISTDTLNILLSIIVCISLALAAEHYQFLFTDVAPTSHFGVYDRRGIPKLGQKAMAESNQPIAVIMEAKRYEPVSIHLVNDTLKSLGKVSVRCLVTDESLNTVHESCYEVEAPKNCNIRVSDLHFAVEKEKEYTVRLTVTSKEGELDY